MTYAVTTHNNLRDLCITHSWFTCGTNEQYEKLFYANENGYSLKEIAIIIWLCSDGNWCKRDILSILIDERKSYLKAIDGE